MKIDTKQTTLLSSPSFMVNPNKNIPKEAVATVSTPSKKGRQVKFEPTIVFTPVATSNRTKRDSPEKRPPRLSMEQVDDVCNLLDSLFIDDAEATNEETKEEIAAATDGTSTFGHFYQTITSNKTPNSMVTVRRSARIAAGSN